VVTAYEALLQLDGTPVARLNHAAAVALAGDVEEGLRLIDGIEGLEEYLETKAVLGYQFQ
jgi:RNA polymerase sigma-70 factor (ECF subfamily)